MSLNSLECVSGYGVDCLIASGGQNFSLHHNAQASHLIDTSGSVAGESDRGVKVMDWC